MSSPQVTKAADPLATLRINRGDAQRRSSGWFGKLLALCVLVGVAAGGSWAWSEYGEQLTRPEVRTALVQVQAAGDADSVLSAQGYLKSEKQAAIGAKVPGRVLKVYVKEGQPVAANELLAELEHADLDETLEAMKASLEAKEASLEAMRLSLDKSKAELAEIESTAAQDERDFARAEQLFRDRAAHRRRTTKRREAKRQGVAQPPRFDGGGGGDRRSRACARRRPGCRESQARYREAGQQRREHVRAGAVQGHRHLQGGRGRRVDHAGRHGRGVRPRLGRHAGRPAPPRSGDRRQGRLRQPRQEGPAGQRRRGAVPNRRFGGRCARSSRWAIGPRER